MARIRYTLAACLYTLESDMLDIQVWLLRRIERLIARQITLLDAAAAYTEKNL